MSSSILASTVLPLSPEPDHQHSLHVLWYRCIYLSLLQHNLTNYSHASWASVMLRTTNCSSCALPTPYLTKYLGQLQVRVARNEPHTSYALCPFSAIGRSSIYTFRHGMARLSLQYIKHFSDTLDPIVHARHARHIPYLLEPLQQVVCLRDDSAFIMVSSPMRS